MKKRMTGCAGMGNISRLLRKVVYVCIICGSPLRGASGCSFCCKHLMKGQIIRGPAGC